LVVGVAELVSAGVTAAGTGEPAGAAATVGSTRAVGVVATLVAPGVGGGGWPDGPRAK